MKKYFLLSFIILCLGLPVYAQISPVTCCTKGDMRDCPNPNNECCNSDCKDVDLSGDYGGTSQEAAEKKRCCEKRGGTNIMDPGSSGTWICCSPGSSKKFTGSYDKICCNAAGGKDLGNNKCCSQWSVAKKEDAALPMCKK